MRIFIIIKMFIYNLFGLYQYRNPLAKSAFNNKACLCGSGKKVKKCCGKNRSVSKKEYVRILAMFKATELRMLQKMRGKQ